MPDQDPYETQPQRYVEELFVTPADRARRLAFQQEYQLLKKLYQDQSLTHAQVAAQMLATAQMLASGDGEIVVFDPVRKEPERS